MKLGYRKDIDGLRAIAVLAVVLNHAGFRAFEGGYVGVDVFFVISGFLITAIIAREIQDGEFTIYKFYERRIRRILPALTGLTLFVLLAGFFLYDDEKIKAMAKSIFAAMLFYSNINFWMESGYFDAPSQLKPLLHTWSLAVEEQFYIVFPLLMVFLSRFGNKARNWSLFAIALLSFGAAVYQVGEDAATAFYLAHFRAWELLIGAFLALDIFPLIGDKRLNTALGFFGLGLILFPIFSYTESTPFPGLGALAPVLGAALVIYSNTASETLTAKILGFAPFVFVGKISYSLYLWHWPLIIFSKYYLIRPMTGGERNFVLALTLVISIISWRFIETPFRSKTFISASRVYAFAAVSMLALLSVSWGMQYHPTRFGLQANVEPNKQADRWLFKECNINYLDNPTDILTCDIGATGKPASFMVWGDSHAPTYGKALHMAARGKEAGVVTYRQACPPLVGMLAFPEVGDYPCNKYNDLVIDYLRRNPQIKTVILASRLNIWVEGTRYKSEQGGRVYLEDVLKESPKKASKQTLFKLGLERTIRALKQLNRRIVIVVPVPEIGYDVSSAAFIASRTGRDVNQIIAPSREEYLLRNKNLFAILEQFAKNDGVELIYPSEYICMADICRVAVDGMPLYVDDDHLSVFGSEWISPVFEPLFVK